MSLSFLSHALLVFFHYQMWDISLSFSSSTFIDLVSHFDTLFYFRKISNIHSCRRHGIMNPLNIKLISN